jgi:hypothetical protein
VVCINPNDVIAGNVSTLPDQVVTATEPIVRKPNKADASPACFPKDPIVIAVPNGLASPIPQRNAVIDRVFPPRQGRDLPTQSATKYNPAGNDDNPIPLIRMAGAAANALWFVQKEVVSSW